MGRERTHRMGGRGIHPLISALILIVISVVAGALFFAFMMPMITGMMGIRDFIVRDVAIYSTGPMQVVIRNAGTVDISGIEVKVDGERAPITSVSPPLPLKAGGECVVMASAPKEISGTVRNVRVDVEFTDGTRQFKIVETVTLRG